jgi:Type IV secretion system pilin
MKYFLTAFVLLAGVASFAWAQQSCGTPGANPTTCIPTGTGTNSNASCPPGGTLNPNGTCNLGYTPLEPIPRLTTDASGYPLDLSSPTGFAKLINNIYITLISVGALLAVVMLTVSGVRYMLAGPSLTEHQKALARIRASLLGLVLLCAAYLILNTINPQLVIFRLSAPCTGANCLVTPAPTVQTTNTTQNDTQAAIQAIQNSDVNKEECQYIKSNLNSLYQNLLDLFKNASDVAARDKAAQDYLNKCAAAGLI